MFILIKHVNGKYDPETNQHVLTPEMKKLVLLLQSVTEKAIIEGWDVLYMPNMVGMKKESLDAISSDVLGRVLEHDPYLSGLSPDCRVKVMVRLNSVGTPLSYEVETVAIEDSLVRKHKEGFVVGAYTYECVSAAAKDLKARHPAATIHIDESLCIKWHPGQQARSFPYPPLGITLKSVDSLLGYDSSPCP